MSTGQLLCRKCGNYVSLGRVFCDHCGEKLDLTGLSLDKIPVPKKPILPLIIKILVPLFFILVAICIGLALWPDRESLGKTGTRVGATRVESQLAAVGLLSTGQSLTISLAEDDLNAFFDFYVTQKLGLQSLRIKANEGYFIVRTLRQKDPITIGRLTFVITITKDIICVPVGNKIIPRRGRIGHLKLPGFILKKVAFDLASSFDSLPSLKSMVVSSSGIVSREGRIEISYKK